MSTYLILGGTGKTGRRVVSRLAAAGDSVRAASRSGDVPFDWADASTWDAALSGVDAVYLVPPALRLDYAPDVAALAARARRLGVSRAVLLSARGADGEPGGALAQAEKAVQTSGLEWTIVRPSWFMQNFTEGYFAEGVAAGRLAVPAGTGVHPFVDADDIADVAVAALTEDGHAGEAYDLSGPEALSFGDAAAALGASHEDADPREWQRALAQVIPADYAELLTFLLGLIRDGHDAELSDGVQRALGREPGSFAAWVEREVAQAAPAAR